MGLLDWLRGSGKRNAIPSLEESIGALRLGTFARLQRNFRASRTPVEAQFLAAAVINEAVVELPANEDGARYLSSNLELIKSEARRMYADAEIARGLSYLYAAQTILLAITLRDPFSSRAQELGARATALAIHIPNTYDICGSGDALQCIRAIQAFASGYVAEFTART